MKAIILGTAALFVTTACSMDGGGMESSSAGSTSASSSQTPTMAASYVPMAGASDLFEIQSSQLALQKSQDNSVREFAQMMITHHTQTTQQVTTAAREDGMTPPPPALNPQQRQMMSQLQPLNGTSFDSTYLTQQVQAHEMALALHSGYAEQGDRPALRRVAGTARPIVQQHLERARTLSQR